MISKNSVQDYFNTGINICLDVIVEKMLELGNNNWFSRVGCM